MIVCKYERRDENHKRERLIFFYNEKKERVERFLVDKRGEKLTEFPERVLDIWNIPPKHDSMAEPSIKVADFAEQKRKELKNGTPN